MNKSIHPWRLIVYVCALGLAALASILGLVGPSAKATDFLSYYLALAIGPVTGAIYLISTLGFTAFLIYTAFYFIFSAFWSKRDPHEFFSLTFLKRGFYTLLHEVKDILVIVSPVALAFVFVSIASSSLNYINATRLIDDVVVEWDKALFGGYPFIIFHSLPYPDWFVIAVEFCFMNLAAVLIAFSLYVFFAYRDVFEEMAAVFCLSLVIMIFFWELLPVLSPHDRYISNVYDLPVPTSVSQAMTRDYQPHQRITEFMGRIREAKNLSLGGVMPTSTLPSAHVAWGTLFLYYAYRTRKFFLWGVVPFVLLSDIGTFMLGQHYFIDFPAGVAVMAFSIWLVQKAGDSRGLS